MKISPQLAALVHGDDDTTLVPGAPEPPHDKRREPLTPDISGAVLALEDWVRRDLPPPDPILGAWLTTTSRVLFTAPTGLGKTLFGVAAGMHISANQPFLRWHTRRPCKVLYVDGEMSGRLMKQRLVEEAARLGAVPPGFFVLNHEDVPHWAPLNTPEGVYMVEQTIERIGKPDVLFADNIMCLISGDMKDEEGWRQTLPWQHSLTRRGIGQVWLHHTGHDESKSYGTKTREWQMDTVLLAERLERDDTDVSFKIMFKKARERTPSNRADFTNIAVALVGNEWTHIDPRGIVSASRPSPTAIKFLAALSNAVASSNVMRSGVRCATMESWQAECITLGLIDPKAKRDSARALFSKYRLQLIACNLIACGDNHAWRL
jgi:hypothetical protein